MVSPSSRGAAVALRSPGLALKLRPAKRV